MSLWIQISSGSDKPIYVQVAEQISMAIAKGEISAGDKLPAVRRLASELVINPNTVAHSYNVLEQCGLVISKTGSGTFVSNPKLRSKDAADINILTERMNTLIARGMNLGFKDKDLISMFKDRLSGFKRKTKSEERR